MKGYMCLALAALFTLCCLPIYTAAAAPSTGMVTELPDNAHERWALGDGGWYYYTHIEGSGYQPRKNSWLEEEGERWYYLGADGIAKNDEWAHIGSHWYYFDSQCRMDSGWLQQTGPTGKPVWYYLHQQGGVHKQGSMATGWKLLDGSWYYFNSNGAMRTGWVKSGGSWYYLKADGSMATGWVKVDGNWYYARTASDTPAPSKEGAILQGGRWRIGGKPYRFDGSGAIM